MHILVVDDDIPTVEVIRTSLHWDLLGIDRVETAYDYTEAQNKICASQPDIILCDIEMPAAAVWTCCAGCGKKNVTASLCS